ncbi:hypothetical protein ACN4EK_01970 [Pantanalinema rosaneae CENA516]|uniref:hypothetical protein n=1 Tax=Pantanalinema rosaneae TaxID=1620701 RepID=UPI003D6E0B6F
MKVQRTIQLLLSSLNSAFLVMLGVISAKPASTMELVPQSFQPSVAAAFCWDAPIASATEGSQNCPEHQPLLNSDHLLFAPLTTQTQSYPLMTQALLLNQFNSTQDHNNSLNRLSTIADWLASSSKTALTSSSGPRRSSGYVMSASSKSASYAAARDRQFPLFSIIGISFSILGLRYILQCLVDD